MYLIVRAGASEMSAPMKPIDAHAAAAGTLESSEPAMATGLTRWVEEQSARSMRKARAHAWITEVFEKLASAERLHLAGNTYENPGPPHVRMS